SSESFRRGLLGGAVVSSRTCHNVEASCFRRQNVENPSARGPRLGADASRSPATRFTSNDDRQSTPPVLASYVPAQQSPDRDHEPTSTRERSHPTATRVGQPREPRAMHFDLPKREPITCRRPRSRLVSCAEP